MRGAMVVDSRIEAGLDFAVRDLAGLIEDRLPLHLEGGKCLPFGRGEHGLVDEPRLHRRPGNEHEQCGHKNQKAA